MTLAEKPQDVGIDDRGSRTADSVREPGEGLASKVKPLTRDADAFASASRPLPSGERWGGFGFSRRVIFA